MNLFTDPAFRAETDTGTPILTWPGLLAALWRREVRDLPALQIHQRPAVILHAAIWLGAAAKHGADPSDPDKLHTLFADALGEQAGRLAAGPDEIAFYQPAIANPPKGSTWNPTSIDRVDAYFGRVLHETKGVASTASITAEHAVYALLGGQQRIFVKDNPASPLWGLPLITPIDAQARLGFEVRALADAYAASRPEGWKTDPGFADHIAWARTWDLTASPLMPDALGWPYVDAARPTRIAVDDAGRIGFRQLATTARLVADGPADAMADHPGCTREGGAAFRLTKRGYSPRVAHSLLFEHPTSKSSAIQAPPILAQLPADTAGLRIRAVAYDQGKTIGVADDTIPFTAAPPPQATSFAAALARTYREETSVIRSVSQILLERQSTTRRSVLGPALATLFRPHASQQDQRPADDETVRARVDAVRERFDARVGPATLTTGLALIAREPQPSDADIRDAANDLCVAHARTVFFEAVRGESGVSEARALAAAEAAEQFSALLRKNLDADPSEASMPDAHDAPSDLDNRARAAVDAAADELDVETAKQLRATPTTEAVPLAFWRLFAGGPVPDAWLEDAETVDALHTLAVSMAHIPHISRAARDEERSLPLGMMLARAGYPNDRADRFLQARGDTLRQLVVEIRNFLDTQTTRLDWRDLAVLLVADAQDDTEALDRGRRAVARAYVRQVRRQDQDAANRTAA